MPKDSTILWHRVVNSQGKISFPEGSDKYQEHRQKLLLECVSFKKNKMNIREYRWE